MTHFPVQPTAYLIDLPRISDPRGELTFVETEKHIPFQIRRVFYLYNVPMGAERGGHSLRTCEQFAIAVAGSVEIETRDGQSCRCYRLDSPDQGLYLPTGLWRELKDFAEGAVCLVLASKPYSEDDYERDLSKYLAQLKAAP